MGHFLPQGFWKHKADGVAIAPWLDGDGFDEERNAV